MAKRGWTRPCRVRRLLPGPASPLLSPGSARIRSCNESARTSGSRLRASICGSIRAKRRSLAALHRRPRRCRWPGAASSCRGRARRCGRHGRCRRTARDSLRADDVLHARIGTMQQQQRWQLDARPGTGTPAPTAGDPRPSARTDDARRSPLPARRASARVGALDPRQSFHRLARIGQPHREEAALRHAAAGSRAGAPGRPVNPSLTRSVRSGQRSPPTQPLTTATTGNATSAAEHHADISRSCAARVHACTSGTVSSSTRQLVRRSRCRPGGREHQRMAGHARAVFLISCRPRSRSASSTRPSRCSRRRGRLERQRADRGLVLALHAGSVCVSSAMYLAW